MYRRIEDFTGDFRHQAEETLKLFRAIPESAAGVAIPGGRSLGRLAWHLTCSLGEIGRGAGLGQLEPHDDQGEEVPPIAEVVEAYARSAATLPGLLAGAWTDALLPEEITLYGRPWRRGDVLSMLLVHQAHHRGQMTVLMRQAGLAVPGMVGPAREEWGAFGMPAQR